MPKTCKKFPQNGRGLILGSVGIRSWLDSSILADDGWQGGSFWYTLMGQGQWEIYPKFHKRTGCEELVSNALMYRRRQWHPTPVLLPGKSQGQGSVVGCCLWGHTESDTTEATQQQQQPSCIVPTEASVAWQKRGHCCDL